MIALEAAFGNGPGVIVIAGTGSIAYGRNAKVRQRAPVVGASPSPTRDRATGSVAPRLPPPCGAWDEEPGQNVPLIEILMKSWRLETIEQLVLAANATPPPDFAALFPAVLLPWRIPAIASRVMF